MNNNIRVTLSVITDKIDEEFPFEAPEWFFKENNSIAVPQALYSSDKPYIVGWLKLCAVNLLPDNSYSIHTRFDPHVINYKSSFDLEMFIERTRKKYE